MGKFIWQKQKQKRKNKKRYPSQSNSARRKTFWTVLYAIGALGIVCYLLYKEW